MKHCEIYHIAYNRVLENVGSLSGSLPYNTMQYYTVHAIPCNIDGVFFFSPTFSNDKYFLNLLAENMFRLGALSTYNHKSYYKQSNWLRTTHFHSKKKRELIFGFSNWCDGTGWKIVAYSSEKLCSPTCVQLRYNKHR